MALHALQRRPKEAKELAQVLNDALDCVQLCSKCRNLAETTLCETCSNPRRDCKTICVVSSVEDLIAVESTNQYSGTYFVMHGLLSPIDGIGPSELGIGHLIKRVESEGIEEVILATNPSIEGETTNQYIQDSLNGQVTISRIAQGIPMGGELGYVSSQTIAHALQRREYVAPGSHD